MKKRVCFVLFCFLGGKIVKAQETTEKKVSPTTFTFSADAYYKIDLADRLENNRTSFTNSTNSFSLGMASAKVDHTFGKVAATIDVGFGQRTKEFSYNDTGIAQIVKQAYISYSPNSKVKFTMGKWATHFGYEVVDAYLNRNYSMSYDFSYGPFFHTGLKMDWGLGDKTNLMVGVADPTDYTYTDSKVKMFIAQFSTATKNDKLKAIVNYQGGSSKSQTELILLGTVNDKFGINYDGTIANIAGYSWYSNALYLNYDPSTKYGFTLRTEYFNDTKKVVGINTSVFEATLSANVHFDNLTLIPEVRWDSAKNKIFYDKNGMPVTNAGNFLLAAVYKF